MRYYILSQIVCQYIVYNFDAGGCDFQHFITSQLHFHSIVDIHNKILNHDRTFISYSLSNKNDSQYCIFAMCAHQPLRHPFLIIVRNDSLH